jgi:tetratricopeptide (TPR) repeat protein
MYLGLISLTYLECYELALKDFGCAIELDPNYAWVIARRGGTYKQLAQFEDALKALNRAIELDPNQAWIITRRGVIYRSMGRLNNAFEDFNRAIKLDSNFGLAVYNRGEMYLLQRQFKEALIDFNRAIELNNTNDWCLYLRGLAHQALDQRDRSETDFELAIDFAKQKYNNNPENCNNIFNLATYCVAANKIEQAKHFYSDGLHRGAPLVVQKTLLPPVDSLIMRTSPPLRTQSVTLGTAESTSWHRLSGDFVAGVG